MIIANTPLLKNQSTSERWNSYLSHLISKNFNPLVFFVLLTLCVNNRFQASGLIIIYPLHFNPEGMKRL